MYAFDLAVYYDKLGPVDIQACSASLHLCFQYLLHYLVR